MRVCWEPCQHEVLANRPTMRHTAPFFRRTRNHRSIFVASKTTLAAVLQKPFPLPSPFHPAFLPRDATCHLASPPPGSCCGSLSFMRNKTQDIRTKKFRQDLHGPLLRAELSDAVVTSGVSLGAMRAGMGGVCGGEALRYLDGWQVME